MLLFSTMFVIVNIFFSPFAPSLSSDRVLLFARRRSFTFQLGTLLRDSLLLFFFIYLFTPSDLCACCASLQSFTIVEILFGFFVCMSSILHFFLSSWWLRLIQSSSYIKPRLSACDIYRSLIFTFCRRRCCQKRVRFSIRKETVFRVQRGGGELLQLNYGLNSPLFIYVFFCWVVVVGISSSRSRQQWSQTRKIFPLMTSKSKTIFLPSSSPYNPSLMR